MQIHFSYGSNMDAQAMRLRCPGARALGLGRLEGWSYFIAASGYASLRRDSSAVVTGVLWRLERSDVAALDLYEDVSNRLYRKVWLPVALADRRLSAIVYLTRDRRVGRPRPGYQESVVAAARQSGFPMVALKGLEAWLPEGAGLRKRKFQRRRF